jgi:hypothetical protein
VVDMAGDIVGNLTPLTDGGTLELSFNGEFIYFTSLSDGNMVTVRFHMCHLRPTLWMTGEGTKIHTVFNSILLSISLFYFL